MLKIARTFQPQPPEHDQAPFCQTHRWPAHLRWANRLVPAVALLLLVVGLPGIRAGGTAAEFAFAALSLVLVVLAAAGLISVLLLHLLAAREVHFTRDCLLIRQTGRRELILPYSTYQEEWVADPGDGSGAVRILVFGRNRGCWILGPPVWLRTALGEIARIQQEEGWYDPA